MGDQKCTIRRSQMEGDPTVATAGRFQGGQLGGEGRFR